MFNKLKKAVKNQDLFGHIINLNFNQDGYSHKTQIGGLASIFVKLLMTIFVFVSIKKLVLNEDDKNSSEYSLLDLEQ